MSRERALQNIRAAQLNGNLYRTAHELLYSAPEGQVTLTKDQFIALALVNKWGAARNQLSALSDAAIIEYRTSGEDVTVKFRDLDSHSLSAECTQGVQSANDIRSEIAQLRAMIEQLCTQGVQKPDNALNECSECSDEVQGAASECKSCAQQVQTVESGEDGGIGMVGNIYNTQSNGSIPTNPEPQQPEKPAGLISLTSNQQAAYNLLVDKEIGVNAKSALDLCQKHTLLWVARQTATYWQQLKDNAVRGPGALVKRLTPGSGFGPEAITDDFRQSDVYRRHGLGALFTEAETAERRAAYVAPEDYVQRRSSYQVSAEYADLVIGG